MKTLPLIAAVLFAAAGVSITTDGQARERSRTVQRDAHGGQVSVSRSNARFDAERQRRWQADGNGHASVSREAGVTGASATTSGAITRGADGRVDGGRSTSATGPNGGTYAGSTTVVDGSVRHSHACTDAAGQPIACRR